MLVVAHTSTILQYLARGMKTPSLVAAILVFASFVICRVGQGAGERPDGRLTDPMIVTELPAGLDSASGQRPSPENLRPKEPPARLVLVLPDSSTRLLSSGFFSARDAEVSFDATRILFAGKRGAADDWNVYEATLDGRSVRQITKDFGDCRKPCYQGTLFTLDSPAPWHQITFVGNGGRAWNECGSGPLTNLYSCKPDGSTVRRLTFNLCGDNDPCLLDDGRLLFAGSQRSPRDRGAAGYCGLFAVNIDGTDYSLVAEKRGKPYKRMPCLTTKGMVVFVESEEECTDGGTLAAVTTRRPLHSYRPITKPSEGRFRGPSPLPDGRILVCRLAADGKGAYAVCRLDVVSGQCEPVFRDLRFHCVDAKLVHPRAEPDGRSSNVQEDDPRGKLYCLDVYTSDLTGPDKMPRGMAKRLRVWEGLPRKMESAAGPATSRNRDAGAAGDAAAVKRIATRRVLGEAAVEDDGSFNISIPANTPVQLQLLDERGAALRSCTWIWAKNHESRGCIGCHEDGELAPEDRFAKALATPSIIVGPPARNANEKTPVEGGAKQRGGM